MEHFVHSRGGFEPLKKPQWGWQW